MKLKRSDLHRQTRKMPDLAFDDVSLTSFAGLALFGQFFIHLGLKNRLKPCFSHLPGTKSYARATLFLLLIVHILLGYRELQDCRWYQQDPLIQRILGLKQLPTASTLSRMLKSVDARSVENLRLLMRDMVLERLSALGLSRVTLDFDGSVLSTMRHAEGTAVGFNKKKKGARSYYPLFCTVAQTGQVLDLLHRSGNVHDSQGARAFILACIDGVRRVLGNGVRIEVRMDAAFFSDEIVSALDETAVEFAVSVPFERFTELKRLAEGRQRWRRTAKDLWSFETEWKPKCWERRFRFIFVRQRVKKQRKEPLQLDLFEPRAYEYEYKVVVTNKEVGRKKVVRYHEGRGSQEKVFGELKSEGVMGYVPVRSLHGNQTYLLAALFTHNLAREFQMATTPPSRRTTEKRATLWAFETIGTLRLKLLHRAGRLTRPGGVLTLTLNAAGWLRDRLLALMQALDQAA